MTDFSRRSLLKSAVAGAVGAMTFPAVASAAETKFDKEADVIVLGFGVLALQRQLRLPTTVRVSLLSSVSLRQRFVQTLACRAVFFIARIKLGIVKH